MQVDLIDGQSGALMRMNVELGEALPDDSERREALAELQKAGRYWAGGGAAPLVLMVRKRGPNDR